MRENPLSELARSLAAELTAADFPNIWRAKAEPGNWWADIYTRGAWLHISNGIKGRVNVTADRPRQMERAEYAEYITVNRDRTPQEIARDMMRRIIPHARAHFEKCRAYTRAGKDAQRKHAETVALFAPFKRWRHKLPYSNDKRRSDIDTQRARIDISDDKILSFTVRDITAAEALQILAILEPQQEAEPIPTDELKFFELQDITELEAAEAVD